MLQPKEPNVSKDESCKHLAKIVQPPIRTRLKTINSYASPPFVSNDQKGLETCSIYLSPSGVDGGAGSALEFGGAEGPGAVSRRGEAMVGEVACHSPRIACS